MQVKGYKTTIEGYDITNSYTPPAPTKKDEPDEPTPTPKPTPKPQPKPQPTPQIIIIPPAKEELPPITPPNEEIQIPRTGEQSNSVAALIALLSGAMLIGLVLQPWLKKRKK